MSMTDQQPEYVDPSTVFPANLPMDAAMRQLHERLTRVEDRLDPDHPDVEPEEGPVPASTDPYDMASEQDRADFAEWQRQRQHQAAGAAGFVIRVPPSDDAPRTLGRPSERAMGAADQPDRPGATGVPAGGPAGPVATGAGPEVPDPTASGPAPVPKSATKAPKARP